MSRQDPRATCATCRWFYDSDERVIAGIPTVGFCFVNAPLSDNNGIAYWPAIRNAGNSWCGEHEYVQQAAA